MAKTKNKVKRTYTEDDILEHAAKFGGKRNLREIVITDEDDVQTAYLVRKPSRSVVQAIVRAEEKKDVNAASKLLIGCVLEGDMELLENDGSIFRELIEGISGLLEKNKSEVKKL